MNAFESVHFKKAAYVHVVHEIIGKKWRLLYILLFSQREQDEEEKQQ